MLKSLKLMTETFMKSGSCDYMQRHAIAPLCGSDFYVTAIVVSYFLKYKLYKNLKLR